VTPLEFVKKISILPHPGGDEDGDGGLENDELYDQMCEILADAKDIVEAMGPDIARHAARRRGAAGRASALYLYRVTDVDEDCDPLDYGVVRAGSMEEAVGLTRIRLRDLGLDSDVEFKIMEVQDSEDSAVLSTSTPELYNL